MSAEFRYGPAASHTDPQYVSAMEHFESMTHEQIHTGTEKIEAGEILQASLIWLEAAATLTGSMPATRSQVERIMDHAGWQGPAAEAAAASAHSFAASVDELAAVFGEVGARLGAVAGAAEAVKLAVPPPGDSGPVGAIARVLEAAHVLDARIAEEVMRQEAILAMNMIYKPAYSAAGTAVPALPEPPAQADPAGPRPSAPARPNGDRPQALQSPTAPPSSESEPSTPAQAPNSATVPGTPASPQPAPGNPAPSSSAPAPAAPTHDPGPAPTPAPPTSSAPTSPDPTQPPAPSSPSSPVPQPGPPTTCLLYTS
ncbi:hypothetical protein C8258_26140, partial [Nocardia sp. MDA0666]|uniref:hypothetical protein n=1 Tax=Nocardia sp. MDA0666 TaxID=2135448 RepID=UPI000D12A9E6